MRFGLKFLENFPGYGPGKCPVCGREADDMTLNVVDLEDAGLSCSRCAEVAFRWGDGVLTGRSNAGIEDMVRELQRVRIIERGGAL